jgi:hypothetical protein
MSWIISNDYAIDAERGLRVVPCVGDDNVASEYRCDAIEGGRWVAVRHAVPNLYGFGLGRAIDFLNAYARRAA